VLMSTGGGGAIAAYDGSNVEIHNSTFQSNICSEYVSNFKAVLRNFPDFPTPIPGGGYATSRAALFMLTKPL
jgi:hypothetical protein